MKMAKIFAIMFAVVLAVFCLSGPFAFGGDEHPWDEEGGDDGDGLGVTPAPNPTDGSGAPSKAGFGAVTPEAEFGTYILDFMRYTVFISFIM